MKDIEKISDNNYLNNVGVEKDEINLELYDISKLKTSEIDFVRLLLFEISRYPLLTVEQEKFYGKRLKLKNKLIILKELKDIKDVSVIDLGKVFASIKDEEVKNYVLGSLNSFYDNSSCKESVPNKIVKYYLNEYKKLCNCSKNGIPTVLELNEYFGSDKIYDEFCSFSDKDILTKEELVLQIDYYLQYMSAKEKFITSNLRLVVKFVKGQVTQNMGFLDLYQEGLIGLMKAISKFDVDKGCKFSTYASDWILQNILRAKENKEMTVFIPVHIHTAYKRILKCERKFFTETGRYPTILELASLLNVSEQEILDIKSVFYKYNLGTLDKQIGERLEETVLDLIPDESCYAYDIYNLESDMANKALLADLLEVLNEREREILGYRYGFYNGEPLTLEQTSQFFNVTRERVRQIEKKALKKMNDRSKYLEASGKYKAYR